ncbi:MAG: ATP-binding protein [Candidatus Staskawiczbacteria bacterium]
MTIELLIIIFVLAFIGVFEIYILQKNRVARRDLAKREINAKNKMYEVSILTELSNKADYSLNIENVVETITKSLKDFIDYSLVAYMILLPEKIIFKGHLEKAVSKTFIAGVKKEMLDTLFTTTKVDLNNVKIEETFWGNKLGDESSTQAETVFGIPLIVSGKNVGLMTIANKIKNAYSEEQKNILNKTVQQATEALTRLQNVIETEKSELNAMVSSMTDGVIMTDMYHRIIVVNPAAKKALNIEDNADFSILDLTDKLKEKFSLKDKVEESIRLEKTFVSEEISLKENFYKILVSPVKDRWKMLGSVIVFRDITREKEVERIKEDFTSMIVHELRSPLDSIKKMIEMIRTTKVKKEKQADCFQMIYGSSSDMLELVNNLLDIAKIEAGKFELRKEKSDIKKVIESRIMFFNTAAKDAKVNILSNLDKKLPDSVDFDPHTVSQVLNNLISNAIKFTAENGNVTIQAVLHSQGNSLKIEAEQSGINWFINNDMADIPNSLFIAVTDNGIGINSEQIGKLFNKFTQAKNAFVAKGGTGLGLAITKSIIESHGGIVGVESAEGKGSTFYFTLPIN